MVKLCSLSVTSPIPCGRFLLSLGYFVSGGRARLFVADVDWGAGAIEREDLDLPLDRDCGRDVAHGFVAGLIFELPGDRNALPVFAERTPESRTGVHLHFLTDAEFSFVYRHFFFDRR